MNLISKADRGRLEAAVACKTSGDLLREAPPDVPVFIYAEERGGIPRRLYRKVLGRTDRVMQIHRSYKPDVWYLNTIVQPEILHRARLEGIPCIVHSHELDHMLAHLSEEAVSELVEYPKLIITGSQAVASVLEILGRKDNLEVCYENLALEKIRADANRSAEIRRELGIGPRTYVWAMSGTLDPNKNPALFVELAKEMVADKLDVHFMWIGKTVNGYSLYARRKAVHFNLSERITWCSHLTDQYYDYLNVADGFVLTSTQDSFALVMIEAAALGKPIVSFDSGGVREFVKPGMGLVSDSGNRSDLGAAMRRVMKGELFLDQNISCAEAARYDAAVMARRWESLLHRYFPA